ncbi:MAG TPA: hypothetical protein VNT50_09590 [Microbacterium sp.]|uniref:hypothetical protein n=1 Tax=Microbacterium sp. TaxID=51671 RepID=UPI002B9D1C94|nr:hypothetical protein [Microbacterium sp.]HWI31735.1 hypothetical protein [Microbacterium sp.]
MTTARVRAVLAAVTALVLLALGFGVAVVVGDELGIRTEDGDSPSLTQTPEAQVAPNVLPPALTLDVPSTLRLDVATDELRDAVAAAPGTEGTATLTVEYAGGDPADETYRLEGSTDALRVVAESETGAVRGVYDLAAAVRDGRAVASDLGRTVTSRLGLRMADLGAVGVEPDEAAWSDGADYSHASRAFEDVILSEAPYIEQDALADAQEEFEEFAKHILAEGYNAITFPGFIEYATFEGVDGVYPDDDAHIERALAMQEAFGPMFDYADSLGMKVFLRTDMLTLTTPLATYLTERFGSLDTENPELWDVYAAAYDEVYAAMPSLDGTVIRIGEAGPVYDVEGWDYYSALGVTTVDAVRAMLSTLSAGAEASEKDLVFRTWSVGVGAVGDMHTNPESYDAVLGGIDSPALIVSTKYTLGDFYSWLPENRTLEIGEQRRIVEFQSRREFENFGAFPNDLGAEYQRALQSFLAANPRIEGIWTWTQDGGPWRAGPMSLYLKSGFWQLYDLNTELAVRLARDPGVDVQQVTVDWARRWFSDDEATVTAIAQAMALSREAVTGGMYIGPFAEKRVYAIGLEPPPMMWIFEWDILTGDSAALDVMSSIVGGRVDEAIAEGAEAVAAAERMRSLIESTDAAAWRDAGLREDFVGTMDYEVDVLRMLTAYRAMILHQGRWHATLAPDAYSAWGESRDEFEALAGDHVARYEGDVDYPAFNLTAAHLGVERADRDVAMSWAARILLALAVAWVVIGMVASRTRLVRRPGAAAARVSWIAATRPWRARESTLGMLPLDRWLLFVVPGGLLVATRAIQTSLLSWVHVAATLGAWLVFVIVVLVALRKRSPWAVIAAVGGVVMLRCALLLVALSLTGPGGYWYAFWTEPVLRTVYITIAFALFVWAFVAGAWALVAQFGRRRSTGIILAGVGFGLAVPALVVALVGLEQALTAWNDQIGLLPWGLSRILGITVYLDIPPDAAWWAAGLGALIAVAGVLLALPGRRQPPGRVP